MRLSRFSLHLILLLAVHLLLAGSASAWFGFGDDDKGKSGLDFDRGYDVNTVTTMTGRAVSTPRRGDGTHIIIEIKSGAETISAHVGPTTFWDKNGVRVNAGDEIIVKGSKAQGKDGKIYLLSQRIENRTVGAHASIRNDKGEPLWGGSATGSLKSARPSGEAGGMMRGGGMMHNGGGMMRH